MPEAPGPVLEPGEAIGILGGGQLGRMMATAAAELGLTVHVFSPDPESPAFAVAAEATCAPFEDGEALSRFAASVSVLTYEFENVPVDALAALGGRHAIRPGIRSLEVAQDRLAEKRYLASLGIPVGPFAPVDGPEDLAAAIAVTGLPAILKTRRLGYDGKGQSRIAAAGDGPAAFDALGRTPAILEGVVPFAFETSSVIARAADGTTAAYDMPFNEHRDGILKWSRVPGPEDPGLAAEARVHAVRLAEALGHVGVLTVEWFAVPGGAGGHVLLANEIAPRVHNSGHWTQDGAATSQFAQHVRAVAGWPLGAADRTAAVAMENLIGEEVHAWRVALADPAARLHLYGKSAVRAGRKMGHVNRVMPG